MSKPKFPSARLRPSCSPLYWWGQRNHLRRAYFLKTYTGHKIEIRERKPAFVGV